MFYIKHNYLHFGTLFYPRDYVQSVQIVIAQNLVELKKPLNPIFRPQESRAKLFSTLWKAQDVTLGTPPHRFGKIYFCKGGSCDTPYERYLQFLDEELIERSTKSILPPLSCNINVEINLFKWSCLKNRHMYYVSHHLCFELEFSLNTHLQTKTSFRLVFGF